MNQVFAGGLALIIALILWSSKKQSKASAFLKSQKYSFSQAQVATSSLVIEKILQNQKLPKLNNKKSDPLTHQHSLNSIETKKQLTKLISSNPNDRLLAIQIASQWENNKALPFLRRGLRILIVELLLHLQLAFHLIKDNLLIYIKNLKLLVRLGMYL